MKHKLFILILVMLLLLTIPVEARELKDIIKLWFQGFNGANQVTERIFNNSANMTGAGGTSAPVGVTNAAFPSHNDSTRYFSSLEDSAKSSYSMFGIENIKDDTKGFWCCSGNFSTADPYRAIVSVSDGTSADAATRLSLGAPTTSGGAFNFDNRNHGANIVAFTFGAYTAGTKVFVCVGNTGERFWAFQDGSNRSVISETRTWYANLTAPKNGTFGAHHDFNLRFINDEPSAQIDSCLYGNDTPTTEELIQLWNGSNKGSDPLNYSNVFENASVVSDTTAPIVNTSFNISTFYINSVINFSGNITDETGLSTANITHNMSGILTKLNFTITGTSASISNTTRITTGRGSVINFTMYATDTSNNVKINSTIITVANTPPPAPTINQPAENTLYNIQPLNLNITIANDADSDVITQIKWWINGTLNQTTGAANTTLNASDGKYNLSVAIYDGFDFSANATILSFKIDTINPTTNLTTAIPNLTYITANKNFTIGATDTNLYGFNITCWQGDELTGTILFSYEALILNQTTNSTTLNISTTWGDNRYTCVANASDDHTSQSIPDYATSKDIATSTVNFNTSNDFMTIKLKKADISLLDFYTYKTTDRYVFVFNFSNTTIDDTIHNYTFKTSSNDNLIYRNSSKFPSHFVTKSGNWIDYNLKSNYTATYNVKEAPTGSGKYETTVSTQETTLVFESIGGVNRIGQRTQVEIDTQVPAFSSRQPSNATTFTTRELQINITIIEKNNLTAELSGNFSGTYKLNQTKGHINNTKLSFDLLNLSTGTYIYSIFANDSAGNSNTTANFTFTIDALTLNVSLSKPENNTVYIQTLDEYITFQYNTSKSAACTALFNSNIIYSNSSSSGIVIFIALPTTSGDNIQWLVNCTDAVNNKANSSFLISIRIPVAGTGSTGGGIGGGGSYSFSPIYKPINSSASSNTANSKNNSIISAVLLNETHIKAYFPNGATQEIQLFTNLSTGSSTLDFTIPIYPFTIESLQPKTADILKYFVNMNYISKESLSQSVRINGIRILTPVILASSLLIWYLTKALRRISKIAISS